jgi:hypothetical protein
MHFSRIRISRPIPSKTDRWFFCWFIASSYKGALSSIASVTFARDFWMCSTYSSSQYQPSHDTVPSHWNYNNKSRTLIKIITKMATNHNKTWQTITHFTIRTHVEDVPLVGTLLLHHVLPHSFLSTLAARNEWEVRPQSLRDPCEAEDPEVVAIYDSIYLFSSTTINFSFCEPWN